MGQEVVDPPGSLNQVPRCREECPVGYFGQDCAETCDCVPGARCFSANGACLCEHGFTGDRCAERLCPDGLYGLSCQVPCTCDPEHSLRWAAGRCGQGLRRPMGEAFGAEGAGVMNSARGKSKEGRQMPQKKKGQGLGDRDGGALGTAPRWPSHSAMPGSRNAEGLGVSVCEPPAQTVPRPRLRPQLPPDERGVLVPTGLGGPSLQRELPAGHARAGLPGALPLPARRRLPAGQRPLPVCARLYGEARPAMGMTRERPRCLPTAH